MDVVISFPGFPHIVLARSVPAALEAYTLPGSTAYSVEEVFGSVLVQEIVHDSVNLHYIIIEAKTAFSIKTVFRTPYRQVQCMLEGKLAFLPAYYYRTQVVSGHMEIHFEQGQLYRLLVISRPVQPQSVQILQPLSPVMTAHVYTLLHTPYILTMQQFYLDTINVLWDEAHRQVVLTRPASLYPEETIINLHSIKAFIEEHAHMHFPIGTLAAKAGLNRQAFKQGFKALFGMGPYAYLLQYRLQQARREVKEGRKPLKQVARQAGYSNTGNFAKAFKRRFEMTPKEMRSISQYASKNIE